MRRYLILLILLLAVPVYAYENWQAPATLLGGVGNDNVNVTFDLPDGVGEGAWLYIPAITAGTVALSASLDGTNFGTVYVYNNAGNLVVWAIASTAGPHLVALPDIGSFRKLKVTLGTQQAANKTFIVFGKRR